MRRKIVAGNWKMNMVFNEADQLLYDISVALESSEAENVEVVVCPPMTYLEMATDVGLENRFKVGAQNCSAYENGAYTGEVSAEILASLEIDYCIVGHSERRKYFNEDTEVLKHKLNLLLKNNVNVIFCCGEQLSERESNNHQAVVQEQISAALFHLSAEQMHNIVIAYEPVWAIGTGKTASAEQAQEMHAFIRNLLAKQYNDQLAQEIPILYGGSCKASNAKQLFAQKDIDGGLIGGASLDAESFVAIVDSF